MTGDKLGINEAVLAQLALFFKFCALGAVMTALYDVIRIFRRIVRHGIIWVSVEDFCYLVFFAAAAFILLFQENDGVVRWYIFGGAIAGGLCYHFLLGRFIVTFAARIIIRTKKRLKKICKTITMWILK